jgi:hypothetical protein
VKRRASAAWLAAALLAVPAAAEAQLFKCVQAGRTVYQQEPCPDTAQQSRVREPDAVPEKPLDPKTAAERAAQRATAEVDGLVEVMAGYSLCAEKLSGFGERYSGAFEDWKQRNVEALGRFNSNPDATRKLDERLQEGRKSAPGVAQCNSVVAAMQPGRGTR